MSEDARESVCDRAVYPLLAQFPGLARNSAFREGWGQAGRAVELAERCGIDATRLLLSCSIEVVTFPTAFDLSRRLQTLKEFLAGTPQDTLKDLARNLGLILKGQICALAQKGTVMDFREWQQGLLHRSGARRRWPNLGKKFRSPLPLGRGKCHATPHEKHLPSNSL